MPALRHILLIIVSFLIGLVTNDFFWRIYDFFFHPVQRGFIDLSPIIGFPLSLEFFIPFLLILLGQRNRYMHDIRTIIIIVALLGIAIDPFHFYVAPVVVTIGILLGLVLRQACKYTLTAVRGAVDLLL